MRSDAVMMTRCYSRTGVLSATAALVARLLAAVPAVVPSGPSAEAATRCTGSEWVGAWTAAPSNAGLASEPAPSRALVDQTVWMVVRPTLAGSRARVRLTHRYGAIALPGARDVIILLGVNDLGGDEQGTARQLIDGLATMTRRAKRTGLRVHLGTLTPSGGASGVYQAYGTEHTNLRRRAVNRWIRHQTLSEYVVDFDKAVRDPPAPARLRPSFDSGDHLHPNAAGYLAMAAAIRIPSLASNAC